MASLPNIPQSETRPVSVGEVLIRTGKASADDLRRARQIAAGNGAPLGPLLAQLGMVSEPDLASAYAQLYNLPAFTEGMLPAAPLEACNLPPRYLKEARAVPLAMDASNITLAVVAPDDPEIERAVAMATGRSVKLCVGTISQIERALEKLYGAGKSTMENIVEQIEEERQEPGDDVARLRDMAAEGPVVRLVNLILDRALDLRASDIHIEPFQDQLKVRYRIDGVLQESDSPPARSTAAVLSRIKIMAKMNIAERRLPQDGRIQLRAQGKLVDLRVSTVPTMHGESLVLRILDKQRLALDLDTLGFAPDIERKLGALLNLPHGIILVTGPTGSGKTTTLYAALQRLNTPERKILTVEDPVEYQIDGINQIQVKPQIGLTFASALRSIVRQDPDVILIGEMRDLETARIAVQSALTGHLVFSTLHTNDAGSSITRLLDMGVEDYLLTSTINGILAQRLVRTLCAACREEYEPVATLVDELGLRQYAANGRIRLWKPKGCEECGGTGFLGRTVVTELLTMSEPIRRAVLSKADGATIQRLAIEEGMESMYIDGLRKALRGVTTIEEVARVTQE
jgi:general secretion pathway protein E